MKSRAPITRVFHGRGPSQGLRACQGSARMTPVRPAAAANRYKGYLSRKVRSQRARKEVQREGGFTHAPPRHALR